MADLDSLLREAVELTGKLLRNAENAHAKSEAVLAEGRASATAKELERVDHPARNAVSIQPASANPKLSPQRSVEARSGRNRYEPIGPFVASTYVSIAATCPSVCPFRDAGCFAQAGAQHLTMGRLDAAGRRTTALEVSLAEAQALHGLWKGGVPLDGHSGNGRDLRLHVGGDVSCERGAAALSGAVRALKVRGLGAAWTYSHRHREIPRAAWRSISVLASCETEVDVELAVRRGYVPAITVPEFPRGRKAFSFGGVRMIPCPFEAGERKVTCVTCRLCLDDDKLRRRGLGIAFAAHGKDADAARTRLRVLNGGGRG